MLYRFITCSSSFALVILTVTKHFYNVQGKLFFDFSVTGNGLGDFSSGVLIPVMFATMTDKDASHFIKSSYEISAFHDTSSSATLRTEGITPLVKSL